MRKFLLLVAAGSMLSGCATFDKLASNSLSFIPRGDIKSVKLPDIPESPQDDFVAGDLTESLDGRFSPELNMAVVANKSTAWKPIENSLRKKGYAVTTVPKMRKVQSTFTPVIYTLDDVDDMGLLYGRLRVGEDFEASRLYDSDGFTIVATSPVSVKDNEGQVDE